MTDGRTFDAETRLLFRVALAIFTVTVLIGMFNGFHFIQLSRAMLLTHVHAGTLGWITLVATGAAFWLYADGGSRLKGHARGVAIGMSVAVPVYVAAFLSGNLAARAIFGVPVLLLIVGIALNGSLAGYALAVPVIAGSALIVVFVTYLVPQLTSFMSRTGGALPLPTRILLLVHHTMTTYWWLALLIIAGAIAGLRIFIRTEEGRIAWDRFRLRIPGYGRVQRQGYYAQFSRTLGTLMENGIPLLRSLDLVSEIAGNRFLESQLAEARRAVIDGATLSAALSAQQLFPHLFTDMMAVGEQTGHFAETMQTIADVYERELDRAMTFIATVLPIAIIVVIAILVGAVVWSILSAVFEMTHSLQFRPH